MFRVDNCGRSFLFPSKFKDCERRRLDGSAAKNRRVGIIPAASRLPRTGPESIPSRGMQRQRPDTRAVLNNFILFSKNPNVAWRRGYSGNQRIEQEIALGGIGTGGNLPTGTVPVQ